MYFGPMVLSAARSGTVALSMLMYAWSHFSFGMDSNVFAMSCGVASQMATMISGVSVLNPLSSMRFSRFISVLLHTFDAVVALMPM